MRTLGRRLLALLLAAALLLAGLTFAAAEDWRDMLRGAFGLADDYDGGAELWDAEPTPKPTPTPKPKPKATPTPKPAAAQPPDGAEEFRLPITDPQQIVNYLARYGELPENFITKDEAKALGWDSRYNYVGEVAPGKSIGGDRFGNYEGLLPAKKGRKWYECDANYRGKKRGAQRVLFSSDGLYYYTDDHYQTFTQMFPED